MKLSSEILKKAVSDLLGEENEEASIRDLKEVGENPTAAKFFEVLFVGTMLIVSADIDNPLIVEEANIKSLVTAFLAGMRYQQAMTDEEKKKVTPPKTRKSTKGARR